tara:strand:- start:952 stop:1197 length:246 start_codon:yes stop_codon:yes gene_type:complete
MGRDDLTAEGNKKETFLGTLFAVLTLSGENWETRLIILLGFGSVVALVILSLIYFGGESGGPGLFDSNNFGPLEMGPQGVE